MVLWLASALPAAAAHAGDPGRGQPVYAMHCVHCHGETGRPVWPGTPDFKRSTVLLQPDARLVAAIRRGRGPMPGYAGVIRDRDMPDLVAYLRTLH
jgi:cytochrome c6